MNSDSAIMAFPTRDQFIASYFRQYFALPDSIIYYILKNPASSKIYQKLIQCCKFFFIKNPILVFHCIQIDDDGWKICSVNCKARHFTKRIEITKKTLSACKLWIQNKLRIYSTNSNFASDLIMKIYQCDIRSLDLCDQHISLQQLLFYSQHVRILTLDRVIINSATYSEMPVEEIVAVLPKLENFNVEFHTESKNVSPNTVTKLLEIPHFKNIQRLTLLLVSEEFDIDTFFNYCKNKSTPFYSMILYLNVPSDHYEEKLEQYVNEILDFQIPSVIFYPGQDDEKEKALIDLNKKLVNNNH